MIDNVGSDISCKIPMDMHLIYEAKKLPSTMIFHIHIEFVHLNVSQIGCSKFIQTVNSL